jgi:hypothetical protein
MSRNPGDVGFDGRLQRVLEAYEAAWNEPDPVARVRFLEVALDDAVVLEPGYKPGAATINGVKAVSAEMAAMIGSRPGDGDLRLALTGAVDHHHGWVRFHWRVADPGGDVLSLGGVRIEGVDVARLGPDGRLDLILVFVGDRPLGGPTAGSASAE